MKQHLWQAARLKRMSKEAFDNLPGGVCFFNNHGIVTLCNRQMHRLVFALSGRDLQSLYELRTLMERGPMHGTREQNLFRLDDGSVWRFSEEAVCAADGKRYTQVIASNVTVLYEKQKELEQNNMELAEHGKRLRRLSAEVAAVTREEEILSMKMRVHDDIGRSVIATRRLLQQGLPTQQLDLTAWKNAIHLLKRDSESPKDKDALTQLTEAAAGIGVAIRLEGKLPRNDAAAYLLITAMRECATNCARHAGGTELYVRITQSHGFAAARITNNGSPPEGPLSEGGGLSSLRARVEKAGGTMLVRSAPEFELTVTVPINEEETP